MGCVLLASQFVVTPCFLLHGWPLKTGVFKNPDHERTIGAGARAGHHSLQSYACNMYGSAARGQLYKAWCEEQSGSACTNFHTIQQRS